MVQLVIILTETALRGALFGLMAIGLTLTYITTKVPNFAYGSFVTIGIYTSFSLYHLGLNPYLSAPIAFAVGGASSVGMYLGILRPLYKRGSSLVSLMISTLALDIAFVGVFGFYTDYLKYSLKIDGKAFPQLSGDFKLLNVAGLAYVAPVALGLVTLGLFLLLTRTKFGVDMRASVENPSLARVLGINVEVTYVVAWFLAGGFAGMAGAFYTLESGGTVFTGSALIVDIFAASVLGGLASIYGGAIGGVMIGIGEGVIATIGVTQLGSWVGVYQPGIPLITMMVILLVIPQGLTSVHWRTIPHRSVVGVRGLPSRIVEWDKRHGFRLRLRRRLVRPKKAMSRNQFRGVK